MQDWQFERGWDQERANGIVRERMTASWAYADERCRYALLEQDEEGAEVPGSDIVARCAIGCFLPDDVALKGDRGEFQSTNQLLDAGRERGPGIPLCNSAMKSLQIAHDRQARIELQEGSGADGIATPSGISPADWMIGWLVSNVAPAPEAGVMQSHGTDE